MLAEDEITCLDNGHCKSSRIFLSCHSWEWNCNDCIMMMMIMMTMTVTMITMFLLLMLISQNVDNFSAKKSPDPTDANFQKTPWIICNKEGLCLHL